MSDPRIATVAAALAETGATSSPDDTDTVALKVVNALDREHGAPADDEADDTDTATLGGANPETPVGTGQDGGDPDPAR